MKPRLLHVTTVPMTLCFVAGHVAHAKRRAFDVHALSSPGEPPGPRIALLIGARTCCRSSFPSVPGGLSRRCEASTTVRLARSVQAG